MSFVLSKDTFLLFAAKNYRNTQFKGIKEFQSDIRKFATVNKLLGQRQKKQTTNPLVIMNAVISIYNVFGESATPMMFFKIRDEFHPQIKSICLFLNKIHTDTVIEELGRLHLNQIKHDVELLNELERACDEAT